MNRSERRRKVKEYQKTGIKRKEAKILVNNFFTNKELEEGTKVKLDYEKMIRHKEWKNQREDFKDWVINHKNETFTVEWDAVKKEKNSKDKKVWVCLAEDYTYPKWLFHTDTLKVVSTAKIKMNDGTNIEIDISDAKNYQDAIGQVQEEMENINL